MDFWAQHKDFILRILAGIGVFLVALIARSITYGDQLEKAQARNGDLLRKIRSTQVAKESEIQDLKADADRLHENAKAFVEQIGWDLGDDRLEQKLLQRILRYTRRYAQDSDANVQRAVEEYRSALRGDLNSGFGQLRLMVREQLVEEAKEKNIKVEEGIGYAAVTEIESDELMRYLLQLELVARVVRYSIDARVDGIEEIRIAEGAGSGRGAREEVIPGANPDFIQEYEVTVVFTASQPAALTVLDRLEEESPRVPVTGLRVARVKRPVDHLSVQLSLLATAADPDPDVEFLAKETKEKKP